MKLKQVTSDTVNITLDECYIQQHLQVIVQIGGTHIKCDSNVIDIADTSQRADLIQIWRRCCYWCRRYWYCYHQK